LPEEIFPTLFAGGTFFVQPCFGFPKPIFPPAKFAGRNLNWSKSINIIFSPANFAGRLHKWSKKIISKKIN
jgi:hypothetical protein